MEKLNEAEYDELKKIELCTKRICFVSRFIMLNEEDYLEYDDGKLRDQLIENGEADFAYLTLDFEDD